MPNPEMVPEKLISGDLLYWPGDVDAMREVRRRLCVHGHIKTHDTHREGVRAVRSALNGAAPITAASASTPIASPPIHGRSLDFSGLLFGQPERAGASVRDSRENTLASMA
jgi:hypothetical protein